MDAGLSAAQLALRDDCHRVLDSIIRDMSDGDDLSWAFGKALAAAEAEKAAKAAAEKKRREEGFVASSGGSRAKSVTVWRPAN